jgi:ribosomal protein S18 acetylase RimI-like enzyme
MAISSKSGDLGRATMPFLGERGYQTSPGELSLRALRRWLRLAARSPGRRQLLERLAFEVDDAVQDRRPDHNEIRSLYVMSRALEGFSAPAQDVAQTSAFRPHHDDRAVVELLARSFACWHPDQQWDQARFAREAYGPGSSTDHLLVYRESGALVGLCWTKQPPSPETRPGLVHELVVDPSARGRGIGRRLLLAGLQRLRDDGVDQAMLYVETNNLPAVQLYIRLGFIVVRTEHRFGQQPLSVPSRNRTAGKPTR